ncbi:MAG: SIR2 family protein [Alphaproteobacteria bacterium]|nr:SIR2 family protein [Alphaproteobacteria bacterium]
MNEIYLQAIKNGEAVLFLGSGFSLDAANRSGETIPTAQELTKFLAEMASKPTATYRELDLVADELMKDGNIETVKKISNLLYTKFYCARVSDAQKLTACQPWRRIYTTNYDNVVRKCFDQSELPIQVKVLQDTVESPPQGVTQLVHLYGSIERVSLDGFLNEFVLSESQRDNNPLTRSPWRHLIEDDFMAARAIIFIGFSMTDIDMSRILEGNIKYNKEKTFFVTRENEDVFIVNRLQRFGKVLQIGLEAFADMLRDNRSSLPLRHHIAVPYGVKKLFDKVDEVKTLNANAILSLFLYGNLEPSYITRGDISLAMPDSYTISRAESDYDRVIRNQDSRRAILIHSDIGNGKTVFSYQLAYLFAAKGFKVYRFQIARENYDESYAYFSNILEPTIVIFDDLFAYKKLLKE